MIDITALSKSFAQKNVLSYLDLEVHKSEVFCLLGPNGCGKTTLLNLISGLQKPDSGQISIGNVLVSGKLGGRSVHLAPCDRKIGYVFQAAALFPHLSAYDNVAYGLKAKHLSKQEVDAKTSSLLEFVGLTDCAKFFPHQLSGGQKQLVALARSIATDPQVLLLDEPMSAVDVKLKESLRHEFKRLLHKLGITAVYVTHDLTEAMIMSNRVAVLGSGRVEQVGSRDEILGHPNSRYVAEFLGLNVYAAKTVEGLNKLNIKDVLITVPSWVDLTQKHALVTLKPEDVILSSDDSVKNPKWVGCKYNLLRGTIVEITLMRTIALVTVDVGFLVRSKLTLSSFTELGLMEGEAVHVLFKADAVNVSGGSGRTE
jgi:ABC-type Fe3+/spermidine/putrescine transport system ATPase subunit